MTKDDHRLLEKQPRPEESHCPRCGAEPTDESVVGHRLSATGYTHDDIKLRCSECEASWKLGIPIGEGGFDDLWCESCDKTYKLVHRTRHWFDGDGRMKVRLHLKCPICYYFDKVDRQPDDENITLVGYPPITGHQDSDVTPDGYQDGELNTDE